MRKSYLLLFLIFFSCSTNEQSAIYCNDNGCLYINQIEKDTTIFDYFDKYHFSPKILQYVCERNTLPYSHTFEDSLIMLENVVVDFLHNQSLSTKVDIRDTFEHFIAEMMQIDSTEIVILYQIAQAHFAWEVYDKALSYFQKIDALSPKGYKGTKIFINLLEKYHKKILGEKELDSYFGLLYNMRDLPYAPTYSDMSMKDPFNWVSPIWVARCSFVYSPTNGIKNKDSLMKLCVSKGLESLPDAESYGLLKMYESQYFLTQKDTTQCINILGELILNPNTTAKNRLKSRYLLQGIVFPKRNRTLAICNGILDFG